jgi:hypothetical protein
VLHGGMHTQNVVALDARKTGPAFVMASDEHTVHVCDVTEGSCVASTSFTDNVLAVAIHPSASLILVGLRSSVRLLEVFM